jgi:NAD(P)-dependent dehydrogenase (short-subunit alcohol dehydrogenase family)
MNANEGKTVVVTGASSGIGYACVARMIAARWRVFATVRKPDDGDKLKAQFGPHLTPVIMDVKDRPSVMAGARQVLSQLHGRGLDGLVNVAGIGMMRPLEYATPDDLREIFDINVFGQIAVTQAFLPLIRKSRGRVVNISSVGAHIAIPFGSPINASKSAFGTFSDTLRLELHPFGIHVCTVEPGAIKTPAVGKTLGNVASIIDKLPPPGAEQYGEMLKGFANRAYEWEMNGSSPNVVADAAHHALTARQPRRRYRVGKHASLLTALPRILSDHLLDAIVLRIAGLPTKFGVIPSADDSRPQQRAA